MKADIAILIVVQIQPGLWDIDARFIGRFSQGARFCFNKGWMKRCAGSPSFIFGPGSVDAVPPANACVRPSVPAEDNRAIRPATFNTFLLETSAMRYPSNRSFTVEQLAINGRLFDRRGRDCRLFPWRFFVPGYQIGNGNHAGKTGQVCQCYCRPVSADLIKHEPHEPCDDQARHECSEGLLADLVHHAHEILSISAKSKVASSGASEKPGQIGDCQEMQVSQYAEIGFSQMNDILITEIGGPFKRFDMTAHLCEFRKLPQQPEIGKWNCNQDHCD